MEKYNYTILIADDEIEVVRLLVCEFRRVAEKFNDAIKIFEATSGSKALEIINNNPIDALVIDYHFKGGMSGDEIIERIDDPYKSILYILISSRPENEIEQI